MCFKVFDTLNLYLVLKKVYVFLSCFKGFKSLEKAVIFIIIFYFVQYKYFIIQLLAADFLTL